MKTNNLLLLVGDNGEDLKSFESKLMLLRDVDTILHSKLEDAFNLCQQNVPDSVIIFTDKEDEKVFELCRLIKNDMILKNIPVLLAMQEFNQEIVLSGFDVGISDYISFPLSDSDVLVRVIWALQKNEDLKKIEKQEQLLSNLNVVYKNIGIYTKKFTPEVFKNEIEAATKYKKKVCLMAVSLDRDFQEVVPLEKLAAIIKKSTRTSDIIGLADKKTFLVLMPKTSNKGAMTVYKRIQIALNEITASAASIEYSDDTSYEDMNNLLLQNLNEALNQINTLKIAENIILEEDEQKQEIIEEQIEEVKESKNYKIFAQAFTKKLENVIAPVFQEAQKRFQEQYQEKATIEIELDEKECLFIFNNEQTQNQTTLKILNEGLSKVLVDVTLLQNGQTSNNSQQIDLKELDESYILNILDKLNEQFKGLISE